VTSPPYWRLRDYGIEGQLGLEATPEQYVAKMVAVFREVRRVLRDDGTLWLNLGDSYCSHNGGESGYGDGRANREERGRAIASTGLKPKDLVGIPWRVAFALQADGWYLRSDIIWAKPNPMPESVTDRPTKAHEYLFLLAKNDHYHYDADAIREPVSANTHMRMSQNLAAQAGSHRANGGAKTNGPMRAVLRGSSRTKLAEEGSGIKANDSFESACCLPVNERNKRSVWTIATQPFAEAHFATFPEKLVEPCVLAGCPEGGTVIDPFAGSGTTGVVAYRLGRKFIGVELNPEYAEMARRRVEPWENQLVLR
jgi:DNA modification methylase